MIQSSEFGVRSSECRAVTPHSALRILHCVGVVVLLGLLWLPAIADACPGCKEALFDPGQLAQKLSTSKGYALSIGLLLTTPLLLVGTIAALVVRAARKRQP